MAAAASGELALSPDYTASGGRRSHYIHLPSTILHRPLCSSASARSFAASASGGHKLLCRYERNFVPCRCRNRRSLIRFFAPVLEKEFKKSFCVCEKLLANIFEPINVGL